MNTISIRTGIFKEGEDLEQFIFEHIPQLKNDNVLAVTSKIVSLSQNRTAELARKENLIRLESSFVIPTKYVPLTIKDGMIMTVAGIDESNANGKLILLPKDSFESASRLRKALMRRYKIRRLGVLITDSRVLPLRAGVVGVALGYAGFCGIKDYRGTSDLFGRKLKRSKVNIADCLATSAVFIMGEGSEQTPIAIIENAPLQFKDRINPKELIVPLSDDLYFPLLGKLNLKKK